MMGTFRIAERVANGDAVVGPGAGVDDHRIHLVQMRLVDLLAELALEVRLEGLQLHTQLLGQRLESLVDLIERDRPV